VANKVISKECLQMADKLLKAAEDIDSPRFDSARPEIMRLLLNNGGEKTFDVSTSIIKRGIQGAAIGYASSLLTSTGMLISNILSVGNVLAFQVPTEILSGIRKVPYGLKERRGLQSISDIASSFALLASTDAKTLTNLIRYFSAGLKSGAPADIGGSLDYLAARNNVKKSDLVDAAKRNYARIALGPDATDQEITELSKAINLTEEEVVKFATDYEYAVSTSNKLLRNIAIGQRSALAIDEAAKSIFRTLQIAKQARHQAIVDSKGDPRKVSQLQAQYFKEVMDAHEAAYNKEFDLYSAIEKSANFKGVREAVRAMEKKSNVVFEDIFPEDEIPFETIREFALNSTFQRRLPTTGLGLSFGPRTANLLSRTKSKLGAEYTTSENIGAFFATTIAPFAVTPYNIKMEALSYTPLTIAIPALRAKVVKRKMVDGKLKLDTAGEYYDDWKERALLGTMFFTSVASLYAMNDDEGRPIMTGTAKNAEEREVMRKAGIPEQSILISGTYVPYSRLEPLGSQLTLYVDTLEMVEQLANLNTEDPRYDEKLEQIKFAIDETVGVLMGSVFNTPLMESTSNLIDLVRTTPTRAMQTYVEQTTKGFIPTFVSDLARMLDEDERFASTITERMQQRIPLLREELPSREVAGERQPPTALELLTKMDLVPVNNSDVARHLWRLKPDIPRVKPQFAGVKLNTTEYGVYKNAYDKLIDSYLSVIVATKTFDNLNSLEQKELIERELQIPDKIKEAIFFEGMKKELGPRAFGSWYANFNKKVVNAARVRSKTTSLGFLPVEE
jgi:hypothetical protein